MPGGNVSAAYNTNFPLLLNMKISSPKKPSVLTFSANVNHLLIMNKEM